MGPRKRVKPNPKTDVEASEELQAAAADVPLPYEPVGSKEVESPVKTVEKPGNPAEARVSNGTASTPQSSSSWYGGAWPRGPKAPPITHIARESISVTRNAATDFISSPRPPGTPSGSLRSPSIYRARGIGGSSRSLPLAATTTKLNIISGAQANHNTTVSEPPPATENETVTNAEDRVSKRQMGQSEAKADRGADPKQGEEMGSQTKELKRLDNNTISERGQVEESAGWLGWFSRSGTSEDRNPTASQGSEDVDKAGDADRTTLQDAASKNLPEVREGFTPDQRRNSDPNPRAATAQKEQQPLSWLGLWSSQSPAPRNITPKSVTSITDTPSVLSPSANAEPLAPKQQIGKPDVPETISMPPTTDRSSGWTFWSRDTIKATADPGLAGENAGKIAVAGTPSQTHPETAVVRDVKGVASTMNKSGKRDGPQSLEIVKDRKSTQAAQPASTSDITSLEVVKPAKACSTSSPKTAPNLLLPAFKRTYRALESPSLLQQLGSLLNYNKLPKQTQITLVRDPPRIRKALAIGVHGFFPAPFIRTVLGQPTGTSIRFANSAANAIQTWAQHHGYSCEVEKVALEGEGRIAERINLLWKLMLNWIEEIRKADFVMFACHSQGVPVTMMLVAKLIAFGCVNAARIGVCAMAGVNLGPFADYKSRWISGSAGELFEFAKPDSTVSRDYEVALDTVLRFGVKVVYVGSIDDQLVSLESSTFGPISHPNIYRAVFVDGRVHAPDFLSHLVGFALKLRNLGVSDHGLIRELSTPLAGSLYGGEGHSRIYDDDAVYYLAVEHALETSSVGEIHLQIQRETLPRTPNPYILPFAMRGVLEEEYVRTELSDETNQLLKQFDDWKPSNKALKDVKFRLEGIRSKL